jgi:hypothetical protein
MLFSFLILAYAAVRADTPRMASRKKKVTTCRWKGCPNKMVRDSFFCEIHVVPPIKKALPKWVKELPSAIGTGLASSILYEVIKHAFDHVRFCCIVHPAHRTKLEAKGRKPNAPLDDDSVRTIVELMKCSDWQFWLAEALENSAKPEPKRNY